MKKRSAADILRSMQHLEEIFVHDVGIVKVSLREDLNNLQLYIDTNALPNMLDGKDELMCWRGAYKNKEEATKSAEKYLKAMTPAFELLSKELENMVNEIDKDLTAIPSPYRTKQQQVKK